MSRRGGSTFGLTSRRGHSSFRGGNRGSIHFRGGGRGRGGRGGSNAGVNSNNPTNVPTKDEEGTQLAERFENVRLNDEVDEKLGFGKVQEGPKKEGWLVNMHPVSERILYVGNVIDGGALRTDAA
jgi:DNA polymerase epsilon subunit 1